MKAHVSIIMGSESDLERMSKAGEILKELTITHELRVLSAHRTPDLLHEYIQASEVYCSVYIIGAGAAAHLAGVVASHTLRPVIGVPLDSSPLQGVDSLYSTVQMPAGVPVATMAIGLPGVKNAALFAAQLLALQFPELQHRLVDYRKAMREKVVQTNQRLSF